MSKLDKELLESKVVEVFWAAIHAFRRCDSPVHNLRLNMSRLAERDQPGRAQTRMPFDGACDAPSNFCKA